MRHVMNSDMVAHRWAHAGMGEDDHARNWTRAFRFQRARLYSYQTPIAEWYDEPVGRVFLISSDGYSATTASKHLAPARNAAYGPFVFRVPFVTAHAYGRAPRVADATAMHAGNLAHLVATMRDALGSARRATVHGAMCADAAVRAAQDAYRYLNAFALQTAHLASVCHDTAEHDLGRRAVCPRPERVAGGCRGATRRATCTDHVPRTRRDAHIHARGVARGPRNDVSRRRRHHAAPVARRPDRGDVARRDRAGGCGPRALSRVAGWPHRRRTPRGPVPRGCGERYRLDDRMSQTPGRRVPRVRRGAGVGRRAGRGCVTTFSP
jgi:hypothetical protein